jgi:hypothetical protein
MDSKIAAPVVPKVEVRYSVEGLKDLLHSLAQSGELTKRTFEDLSNSELRNWYWSSKTANNTKGRERKEKKSDRSKKDQAPAKSSAVPTVGRKEVKDGNKVSGLNKLLTHFGDARQFSEWNDYVKLSESERLVIERLWRGLESKDAILSVFADSGLSEEEIHQTRAYFPSLQKGPKVQKKEEEKAVISGN